MNILGISGGVMRGNQDAAAVLLMDGELVFAQEEERFTREKHAAGALPEHAIRAALKHAGISIQDVDIVAFHANYLNIEPNLVRYFRHHFGHSPDIQFFDHHLSHAASAYYASDFDDAMIFTTDLSGDGVSTTLGHGENAGLDIRRRFSKPQSLGIFYSLVTQILGFRRDNDEYKVMGMASYGQPTEDFGWLLKVADDGYELNEDYLLHIDRNAPNPSKQEPMYSDKLLKKVGWHRLPGEPYEEKHFNFAASAQHALNEAAVAMVRGLHRDTGSRNLCVAGGVGLNCVMNQSLLEMPEVDRMFVQPASSDAGTALGAAYLAAIESGDRLAPFPGAHLGNEFSPDQIRQELEVLGMPFTKTDDAAGVAAEAVAEGKIVGWFQGRHEFGPRALGSRSIIGDARRADMKDRINHRVKFREEFRPFAPSVLADAAADFFETHDNDLPYMTVTVDAKPPATNTLPAIVHVDGTSRIQTVDKKRCGLYYDLIERFSRLTGTPAILNTSFNVKGQPVVNTPTQAVGTFYGSGMDVAVVGPFVLAKR